MKIYNTSQYLSTIITEEEIIGLFIQHFDKQIIQEMVLHDFRTIDSLYQCLISIEGNLDDIRNNRDRIVY